MKVYVDNRTVTIVGRDGALNIPPDFFFLEESEADTLSRHGTLPSSIFLSSLENTSIVATTFQEPLAHIPDVLYKVGDTVSAGELKEYPPQPGTIIKTHMGRPLEYRGAGQWNYGREKGSIDTHTSISSEVTILSV